MLNRAEIHTAHVHSELRGGPDPWSENFSEKVFHLVEPIPRHRVRNKRGEK